MTGPRTVVAGPWAQKSSQGSPTWVFLQAWCKFEPIAVLGVDEITPTPRPAEK